MRKLAPIAIDRSIPYADNLANAINNYWKTQVAVPDGTHSAYEGNVHMPSEYGVPTRVLRNPKLRYSHPDIVRVRRVGRTWIINAQNRS